MVTESDQTARLTTSPLLMTRALLENDAPQVQLQLDVLKHNTAQVGMEINIDKTAQTYLNMHDQIHDNIIINGQPIAIAKSPLGSPTHSLQHI